MYRTKWRIWLAQLSSILFCVLAFAYAKVHILGNDANELAYTVGGALFAALWYNMFLLLRRTPESSSESD